VEVVTGTPEEPARRVYRRAAAAGVRMPRPMRGLRILLPALLLAAFAFACGSFPGAASWPAGPLGQALLLLAALAAGAEAVDPLRLGPAGRWLPLALLVAVAGSLLASPVPRAGRTALALLPAFLLLPAAVARAFESAAGKRIALALWSAAVAAVGLAGLVEAARSGAQRAAAPLGHHNLLGAFLVTALPVALLSLRARGPERALAALALAAGGGALVATRSLSALAAAVVVAAVAAPRLGRARHLVAGLALLAAGLAVPRAAEVLMGRDPSLAARRVYGEAAIAGFAERPLLGWGPGATPWRLAGFVRPVPGVNPPGELVGEAHSLPLGLLFELGATGALLAAGGALLFALRRARERAFAPDPGLVEAGLLGLLGGAVACLGDAWLAVPALPVALALSAGAALGGGAPAPAPARRWPFLVALALLVASAGALARPALAWRAWDEATRARDRSAAAAALARAADLDPGFPLYRARWAWTAEAPAAERARAALDAAASAGSIAPLWLRAGSIAWEAGERGAARAALSRALALDPLSGAAPFLLFVASEGTDTDCAARALAAEPRLGAATAWRARPGDRARASWRLRRWPGIEIGWKAALRDRLADFPPSAWEESQEVDLVVEVDVTPALASSLHLFRRTPLPADVARIRLDRGAVRRLGGVPSAAELPTSSPAAFPLDRCAPADVGTPAPPAPPGDPLFRDGFESGDPRRWLPVDEPSPG